MANDHAISTHPGTQSTNAKLHGIVKTYSICMNDGRGIVGMNSFTCRPGELTGSIKLETSIFAHCEIAPVVGQPKAKISYEVYEYDDCLDSENYLRCLAQNECHPDVREALERIAAEAAKKEQPAPVAVGVTAVKFARKWMKEFAVPA